MGAHWVELRIVCLFSGDVVELSVIGGRLIISGCVLYLIGNNLVAHWQHKIPMSQWVWGSNASFLIQEPLYITMYITMYIVHVQYTRHVLYNVFKSQEREEKSCNQPTKEFLYR